MLSRTSSKAAPSCSTALRTRRGVGQNPAPVQQQIIDKKLKFYVIDGYTVAEATGMGARVNTIMQTCFFAISGILPKDEAIAKIKDSIKKTYGGKGDKIVQMNYNAVDQTLANLHEVKVPAGPAAASNCPRCFRQGAAFVRDVTAMMIAGHGDDLPVSAFPSTAPSPPAPRCGKNATSLSKFPSGIRDLHPVRQVRHGVSACHHPHQGVRGKAKSQTLRRRFKYCDARARNTPA
jgi:pyruvate-ferredoxin/flavodoxin oxidoreductase